MKIIPNFMLTAGIERRPKAKSIIAITSEMI